LSLWSSAIAAPLLKPLLEKVAAGSLQNPTEDGEGVVGGRTIRQVENGADSSGFRIVGSIHEEAQAA
jgi:hypothetical protein